MFAQEFEHAHAFGRGRGGFGGPDFEEMRENLRGFRAGRGMIEPAILGALTTKPMHGYEIISYLEEKSQGVWRPSAGSVYPTLQLLEEKDLVTYTEENGKKIYQLSTDGEAEAANSQKQFEAIFERFASADQEEGRRMNFRHGYQRQFHRQAGDIMKTMRQIFRKGSAQQKEAMDAAVNEFKVRLEAIERGEI
ncbi:PadR family transcriptional regulator [Candidatus Mycosynbacter amalyticus]|uniref:PadR family transcriptional regulator n=1 Tax=Candidatus Mycosynbacter amalyticus TaxID=2665156 RepID=A0A857MKL0_9BACT|nr:PadR family transcriptional regulator [Candidatus Mycosynbacter amalyticus]QHN43093.1 PadR family transcriptional regulator [Candidatus Mycosynbacter amalyticus]